MVDFKEEKQKTLEDFVRNYMTNGEIVDVYNDFAERNHYELVYENCEEVVDMFTSEMSRYDLLCAGQDYDSSANFICQDIYHTFDYWNDADSPIVVEDIVEELQRSDAFSDSDVIIDGFLAAMGKAGHNYHDVKEWFENEYWGNLMEDDWLDVCEQYEEWKYDRWFNGLEFAQLEKLTGIRQDDFSPEDGYQEFVDACHDWWDDFNREEKEDKYFEFNK